MKKKSLKRSPSVRATSRKLTKLKWLVVLLAFSGFIPQAIMDYGLDSPEPIGAYLNGVLPTSAPTGTAPGGVTYEVTNAFPNLQFVEPSKLLELPGRNKFLLTGLTGLVYTFDKDSTTSNKTIVLDLESVVQYKGDEGLLSAALHPEFGQPGSPNRGYIYMIYRKEAPTYNANLAYNTLVRYTMPDNTTIIDPNSEQVLFLQYDRHAFHTGADMFFGTDGFLYIALGDEGPGYQAISANSSTQQIDRGLFAGIIRIDVDQDPTKSHPIRRQPTDLAAPPAGWPTSFSQNYYIPNDNPWLDQNGGILEEYYAIGIRNPFRMTQDPLTGDIWVGDVGQNQREEINLIVKGGNYQWPYLEGDASSFSTKPTNLIGIDQPPFYLYQRSVGVCVIGGFVYRGNKWPSLYGKYIYGDHQNKNVLMMDYDVAAATSQHTYLTSTPTYGTGRYYGMTEFTTDSNGEVYVLKMSGTAVEQGEIFKLTESTAVTGPPQYLSQTGVFSDLATLTAAPGVIPYTVNAALWSDGAEKRRWVAIPNDGSYDSPEENVIFSEFDYLQYPVGTVFIKHFEMPIDENNPTILQRLETRFTVRVEEGGVYGFTYKWNAAGTDAELLAGADTEPYTILHSDGSSSSRIWEFPSRQDCQTCHTDNSGGVLGPNTHHLNGKYTYPNGETDNQLRTWNHLGIFDVNLNESDIPNYLASAYITDNSASLELRVRSYLDANCAHCHQPGGVSANFDARFSTPLDLQSIINGSLEGGFGGVTTGHVVTPGDTLTSQLYIRDNSVGTNGMPPLAKSIVDEEYIKVLKEWIGSLADSPELPHPGDVASNLQLWLKGDQGVNVTTGVRGWIDQSGNTMHATQTVSANQPQQLPTAINSNPVLEFDGVDDYLYTDLSINHDAMPDLTVFTVHQPDQDNAGALWGEDNNGWDRFIIDDATPATLNNMVSNGAGGNSDVPGLYSENQSSLTTVIYDQGATDGSEVLVNGLSVRTFTASQTGTSNPLQIGAIGSDARPYDGKLAEMIVYDRILSATERDKVESYLALKYGLSIEHDYLASDYTGSGSGSAANPIWDMSTNAGFLNDVAGIGRDDQSGLHQKQSKSEHSSGIVEVFLGNETSVFPAANDENLTQFADDKGFLLWGHDNGGTTTLSRSIWGGQHMAIGRTWKVQESGAVGSVSLRINETDLPSEVTVMYLNRGGVPSYIPMQKNGEYWTATVDFASGDLFSFGDPQFTPSVVSANLELWLKADAGLGGTSAVNAWEDQSGNANHAIQTSGGSQPAHLPSELNFNSVLDFDGSNDMLETPLNINASVMPELTVMAVYQPDKDGAGSVWGEDNGRWDRFQIDSYWPTQNLNNMVAKGSAGNGDITGLYKENEPSLATINYSQGTVDGSTVYVDGLLSREFTTNQTGSSNLLHIGEIGSGKHHFDGKIAEMFVFSNTLSTIDRDKAESYLGMKYGLTLAHSYYASDYSNSGTGTSAAPVWNQIANAAYHNDVAGIGRDDQSGLYQKQSMGATSSDMLQMYLGDVTSDFPAINADNHNSFAQDKSFLMWGHNANTTSALSRSIKGGTQMGINRIWKVQETGQVGTVTLRIPKMVLPPEVSALYIHATDHSFPDHETTTIVHLQENGDYWTAVADFEEGDFFTFGDAATFPGAIAENIQLWLKADAGLSSTSVAQWLDQSGNGMDATQSAASSQPSQQLAGINFNPAVEFDGSNDRLVTQLSINANTKPELTVLSVYQPDKDAAGAVWGEDNGGWDRFIIDGNWANGGINNLVSNGSGGNKDIPNLYVPYQNTLATIVYDQATSFGSQVYVNGLIARRFTANQSGTSNPMMIGAIGKDRWNFDGKIAEVIVYDKILSTIERNKAESYLGLKYGLTLNHDYLASDYDEDGTGQSAIPLWDRLDNEAYHNDVAGIGRDGQSGLDQRQSKSQHDGAILEAYLGNVLSNFPVTSAQNPNRFSVDKSFMIWGHNTGEISGLERAIKGGTQLGISRVWKVQETGDIGFVSIRMAKASLPVGTNTLYLNNQDNTFPDDATTRSVELQDDGTYLSALVDFSDGDMFSFGDGAAAVAASIQSFSVSPHNSMVNLQWTASDLQSGNSFSIERSVDQLLFERIEEIPVEEATQNDDGTFSFLDKTGEALEGRNVSYRITIIDESSSNVYVSEVRQISVPISGGKIINVYPNPVRDLLTIDYFSSDANNLGLQVLSGVGQLVYEAKINEIEGHLTIQTDGWPAGVYFVRLKSESGFKVVKVLKL